MTEHFVRSLIWTVISVTIGFVGGRVSVDRQLTDAEDCAVVLETLLVQSERSVWASRTVHEKQHTDFQRLPPRMTDG